jgi:chromate reductase
MSQIKIAVIVGSLRRGSLNHKLATALARLAPSEFSFHLVEIGDLPLYNQDDDADQASSVQRMKAEIVDAQGLLFLTPEYNRSISGVLKNAIDHGSRPPGKNSWAGKPAGVIGMTPGAIGTAMAQQHARTILAALGVQIMAQPDAYLQFKEGFFDADGGIGEASRGFLQTWMDRYAAFIKRNV